MLIVSLRIEDQNGKIKNVKMELPKDDMDQLLEALTAANDVRCVEKRAGDQEMKDTGDMQESG